MIEIKEEDPSHKSGIRTDVPCRHNASSTDVLGNRVFIMFFRESLIAELSC